MELSHTFNLSNEHVEKLEALRKAMSKYHLANGGHELTLEDAFNFCMELGQNHLIPDRIENAAYYYDAYYDEYPYKYGAERTRKELAEEEAKKNANAL